MKACILSVVEPKHMVMTSLYTRYFETNGIPYDLIYLDRYWNAEKGKASNVYNLKIKNSNIKKLLGYVRFYFFAKKILKSNSYDFIVVWNEYTASLFSKLLSKKYENKYCINVRDLFNEKSTLRSPKRMYPMLNRAISKSRFTTVSSNRYIASLVPFDRYVFVHSINENICPRPKQHVSANKNPVVVMYIGKIGYAEEVKKMIDVLKNDDRFFIKIVGIGSEIIAEYAKNVGCTNIETVGMFESKQTEHFLEEADIIYNAYGDEGICERTALSNKLYYAVCLNVPILVNENTYMYELTKECGIGFPVDKDGVYFSANQLYEWFNNLDRKAINKKCERFIDDAKNSHNLLKKELDKIFINE